MVGKEPLALALYVIGVCRLIFSKMKPAYALTPFFVRRIRKSRSFSPQTLVNGSSRIYYLMFSAIFFLLFFFLPSFFLSFFLFFVFLTFTIRDVMTISDSVTFHRDVLEWWKPIVSTLSKNEKMTLSQEHIDADSQIFVFFFLFECETASHK